MFGYDQILAALRAEGLTVIEVPGSRGRCRCHNGPHSGGGSLARPFAPSGDVMAHITAGNLGSRTPLQYIADIINGDPQTPFKSQFVTDPKGVVYLNGVGRANHAGKCGSAAISASRRQTLSLDGYVGNLRGSDADGNTFWYGIENIAAKSMTAAQRESSVRICAALSRLAGRTGRGTIGHGEASSNRSYADPNLDMGQFRRDVIARVKAGPSGNTTQEDDMADDATIAKIAAASAAAVMRAQQTTLGGLAPAENLERRIARIAVLSSGSRADIAALSKATSDGNPDEIAAAVVELIKDTLGPALTAQVKAEIREALA